MLFVISVALVERDHAGERAFDLADVGFDAAGGVGEANASVARGRCLGDLEVPTGKRG